MKPVVLAGGTGSRLWPKSRAAYPKQFLSLTSDSSLLQDTIARLSNSNSQAPIVVCNDAHRFIVAEQLRQKHIEHDGILLEPVGRNTAPAIALAALHATKEGDDPILFVLPADHVIEDEELFQQAIENAQALAKQDLLVTFGVVPQHPHTGYGYIKAGDKLDNGFNVASFIEKPTLETAHQFIESGGYFWNSGMFMFRASRYLEELGKHAPAMLEVCQRAIETEKPDLDFIRVDKDIFASCPSDSIDYAVMEKTDCAAMVPLNAKWSDVGSWTSLWENADKDNDGNVRIGDTLLENTSNCYINAEQRLVTAVGLHDVIIVETKDAVLVAHKDDTQSIRRVVDKLERDKRPEFEFHREVYRPWGSYDSIDKGARFQVKRLTVKPGEMLSVQMHHHRAEHWVVVSGCAKVTINNETRLLTENESVYIPIGTIHSLENPGKIPLEIIEIQSGGYLSEDDIVRFTDRYGR